MPLTIKRAYDDAQKEDGFRVLVDRIWPRGVSKEEAKIDLWLKDVAPSTELRKWFGHDPKLWAAFKEKYAKELREQSAEGFEKLKSTFDEHPDMTIVFAAKDEAHNNAVVLKELLEG